MISDGTISEGKALHGALVGILMLETQFPRIPGDIGNASTFDFPVAYHIVPGASPDLVVRRGAGGTLDAFVAAGRTLVAGGADGIATTCGFLSLFQDDLRAALGVPVLTSALMQVPLVQMTLPHGQRVGILTISAASLSPAHLAAARVPDGTPIGSTEGGNTFTASILGNAPTLDIAAAEEDNVAAARNLCAEHPEVGALVLECTNMIPYAAAIRAATGRPVFSMETALRWFQSGLVPRRFPR
ncbi:aspartate/glutamate racemase family protein [Pseudaestuariivita sp.]|uniref:aspartate/glutamate racemase family protein n=1 Tax=Pseudaestuariivita sp. TaxID=2211669 RepID=UPI0040592609